MVLYRLAPAAKSSKAAILQKVYAAIALALAKRAAANTGQSDPTAILNNAKEVLKFLENYGGIILTDLVNMVGGTVTGLVKGLKSGNGNLIANLLPAVRGATDRLTTELIKAFGRTGKGILTNN